MSRHTCFFVLCLAAWLALPAGAQRRGEGFGREPKAKVGKPAPDFTLPVLQGFDKKVKQVKLSELAKGRPVALVFGSYT